MSTSRLAYLFGKSLSQTATTAETAELRELLRHPGNEAAFKQLLDDALVGTTEQFTMSDAAAERMLETIFSTENQPQVRRMPIIRKLTIAAAAAAVLIFLGIWQFNQPHRPLSKLHPLPENMAPPATSRAVLTLSNGQQIPLDSLTAGTVTQEKNVQVTKSADGQIIYKGQESEIAYNTISLPKGGRPLQMTFADGTRAWLNAASSITYPTAFAGKNRQVTIQGEVYFEVAKNAGMPFIVKTGPTSVEVLGTHFNINSYQDEPGVAVTLLEGSVRVDKEEGGGNMTSRMLRPGEQAFVTAQSIRVLSDANTEAAIAWKNGYFFLKGTDLPSIMRQVSRWYDVEVVYEGKIPDKRFAGSISRDISLSDLITSLQEYGIEARLNKQTLTISSK